MPDATRPRVVVIGGGFGGLSAARTLKGASVEVVLLDRRNHHVFQPLLYQVATAGLSPGDIASPIRWILRRQSNLQVWLAEVTSIDVAAKVVRLADGEVKYDHLIVSAGATHAYFGHDEWRAFAPGLKTLEDALDVRRRVLLAFELAERETDRAAQRRLLTFVVIGVKAALDYDDYVKPNVVCLITIVVMWVIIAIPMALLFGAAMMAGAGAAR